MTLFLALLVVGLNTVMAVVNHVLWRDRSGVRLHVLGALAGLVAAVIEIATR
jgi:hypothetical protein